MKATLWILLGTAIAYTGYHSVIGRQEPRIERTQSLLRGGGQASRSAFAAMREARSLSMTKANLPRIIADYRQALSIEPDPFAEITLAKLLVANGQEAEARKVFLALQSKVSSGQVGIVSNDPSMALDIAETTRKLGLADLSTSVIAGLATGPIHQIDARFRLPELDHESAHARSNGLFAAGVGKLRVHRNAEAVPLFEEALRERPEWGAARFMLAYAQAYAGRRAEADKAFAIAARYGWKRPRGL